MGGVKKIRVGGAPRVGGAGPVGASELARHPSQTPSQFVHCMLLNFWNEVPVLCLNIFLEVLPSTVWGLPSGVILLYMHTSSSKSDLF